MAIKHSRTSHKLTKTIKPAEKVCEIVLAKIVIALYIVTPKNVKFLEAKKAKLTKPSDAYKVDGSSYYVNILNSFNPELQLKETEFAIRTNLLIDQIEKI